MDLILTRLKAIRARQALSMRELSRLSGVSPSAIVRAEKGEPVYSTTVRRLAKALKVQPAELQGAEPVSRGYDLATPTGRGPGVGNPNLTPAAVARRSATAERPTGAGLAHALDQAERCRRNDDLDGAARWEQIAASIAARIASSVE